jgi:hypothetical protein
MVSINSLQLPLTQLSQSIRDPSYLSGNNSAEVRINHLAEISRIRGLLQNLSEAALRGAEVLGSLEIVDNNSNSNTNNITPQNTSSPIPSHNEHMLNTLGLVGIDANERSNYSNSFAERERNQSVIGNYNELLNMQRELQELESTTNVPSGNIQRNGNHSQIQTISLPHSITNNIDVTEHIPLLPPETERSNETKEEVDPPTNEQGSLSPRSAGEGSSRDNGTSSSRVRSYSWRNLFRR